MTISEREFRQMDLGKGRGGRSSSQAASKCDEAEFESSINDNKLPTILYFTFKILGLIIPVIPICLGYKLFVLGVTGNASIVVNATNIQGQLINAAPGLFFAVGGIIALIFSILKGIVYRA